MSPSAQKVIVVPVRSDASICSSGARGDTVVEGHPEDVALLADLDVEPGRQGVDHRGADAVQATGHLVAAAAELAAGVQLGEHELDGGHALASGACRWGCRGRCRSTRTPPSASRVTSMVSA